MAVSANDTVGEVRFGGNLAKPWNEHSDKLYLIIGNSERLYFNRLKNSSVLSSLDTQVDHVVKVYFDSQLAESWILNFSALKTRCVVIWRSAGSWRMESNCN